MNAAIRLRFRVWLVFLAALACVFFVWVLPRLKVDTDLLALLPRTGGDARIEAALGQFSATLSRKVLYLVGASDRDAAAAAAHAFAAALQRSGAFVEVRAEISGNLQAAVDLYREHRFFLLSRQHRAWLESGQVDQLRRAALRSLYTPLGLIRPIPPARDPLGLGAEYLLEQVPTLGAARLDGTQLIVSDSKMIYVLVPAETAGSPFAVEVQERAAAALTDALPAARNAAGTEVRVLSSGTLQHATAATRAARTEVSVFSTIGTVCVLVLMFMLFRSWRAPALGMLALTAGAGAGITVTWSIFGSVHVIALVFGSALIGVAIDYSMHYFSDQFRAPGRWTAPDALAHVGRPILLGMGATLLGFAGLLVLPFPGLQQMATISIAGLIVACGCVLLLFPVWVRGTGAGLAPWCARFLAALDRGISRVRRGRGRLLLLVVVSVVIVSGAVRLRFEDDIRQLQASFPDLIDQERSVRELLHTAGEIRFFVVTGAGQQATLQAEERLTQALDTLVSDGRLGEYRAVSRSLPSFVRQQHDHALLERYVFAPGAVAPAVMREIGFEESAIARELAACAAATSPLTPAAWLAHPASLPMRHLWLTLPGGQSATIVALGGIKDVQALASLGQSLPGVRFVDRVSEISAVLTRYRQAVLWLLAVAYALLYAALALRYGISGAARMILPPAAASALALSVLGWFGLPANLFTALALLLMLAMGVDYAIFLREAQATRPTALLAVTLSAVTTMLSFGLLAWSSTPLIHSVGLTLCVGIGCCWLLAVASGGSGDHAGAAAQA